MTKEMKEEKTKKPDNKTRNITDDLVNPRYKKLYNSNETESGNIEEAGDILASAYKDVGFLLSKLLLVIVLFLLILNAIINIPLIIYSASIAFAGSILLVYPRLAGRYKVAISATEDERIQMMKEAEMAAFSNAGFFLILIGFVLQVIHFIFL